MRSPHTSATRPVFEHMEPRLLLDGAVTASVVGGELLITGDDLSNSIVVTALDEPGQYMVMGFISGGARTQVNGGGSDILDGVETRIRIDMRSGWDIVNIGDRNGADTMVDCAVDIDLGNGTNVLNIGRVHYAGRLRYGGHVEITGDVSVSNGRWGNGNLYIAGAALPELHADLGSGGDAKAATLVNLLHGMAVDSDLPGMQDSNCVIHTLDLVNPRGTLNMLVRNTSIAVTNITTAEGDDTFDLKGFDGGVAMIATGDGADNLAIDQSDGDRHCTFTELSIETGEDNDSVWISNSEPGEAYIDLGMGGSGGASQDLYLSPQGGTSFRSLAVRGRGLDVRFNAIAGVNTTYVRDALEIRSADGDIRDVVYMRNVLPNETTIVLGGGDDAVTVQDCAVRGEAVFRLGEGNDTVFVGQSAGAVLPGLNEFAESFTIDTGPDDDQVAVANTDVRDSLLVWLGTSRRAQRARIGLFGDRVSVGNLAVIGSGRTNVYIGRPGTPGTSVTVANALTIFTGFDARGDTVVLRNTAVHGATTLFTGNGSDVVAAQECVFSGPVVAGLGRGRDVLIVSACRFRDDARFYGGAGADLFYVEDTDFDGRALFHGGPGNDWINGDLRLLNRFALPGQPELVSVEREF